MRKIEQLRKLGEMRRTDNQQELTKKYKQIGDFHGGKCDSWNCVSPWNKAAGNYDSPIMVIGQDWISEDAAESSLKSFELGCDPENRTNKTLHKLLLEHFGLKFSDIYGTNLFVFIKPGAMNSRIPSKDLLYSARKYTLAEIDIVQPKVVICLGKAAYDALCRAIGVKAKDFELSAEHPIRYGCTLIYGVPHTGPLGINNAGGMEKVWEIWKKMAHQRELADIVSSKKACPTLRAS
ncbi:uracil-DNA glycosylase family protein [Fluviibacter phosphoraccumulans]|uniref:Uracil-DNA glycosylase-like domain-containing protein n=1 Tax=Fluviibacter phosphoraccumulans TaxID=1751046 RepID=A0A679HYG3_9RHOO|nr:uracil-DNA glycosylase family protein [Fluviibacter phosphoraccumulans]BBU68418.1 hypothetical protein ICHIAU1_07010 [Fluviibacter phosphoraccumulans]BBU72427.1 hypothetical protein ICHIJ1_23460 [Fluviibacter phosphoraccumulans]BCA66601.1 hypothetical protein SHINM1_022030 [Fluviibacter phosphoraccumulans]